MTSSTAVTAPGPSCCSRSSGCSPGTQYPDAAKLVFYRPGFYGAQAKKFTHEAMRGPSVWSVADRELMAAFVSKVNESAFCVGAHTATAGQAYQDAAKVQAVLADLESAPVEDGLRATLRMLGKLTREGKVGAEDVREVLSEGVSPQQVKDALAVCAAFNTTGSPTPSASNCSAPRASRQEPSICSSAVTDSTGRHREGTLTTIASWVERARTTTASVSGDGFSSRCGTCGGTQT